MLKQVLLATVLIAVPAAIFTTGEVLLTPPAQSQQSLGDLSALTAIAEDVQKIATAGDLVAAEKRITDFETEWDKNQDVMRPQNPEAWGTIDDAADAAIHSLRTSSPQAASVDSATKELIATLNNPYSAAPSGGIAKMVSGIAVTDATGHPLPCEQLIKRLREVLDGGAMPQAAAAPGHDLLTKALERCNADDDAHANEFSAQGLALTIQK